MDNQIESDHLSEICAYEHIYEIIYQWYFRA